MTVLEVIVSATGYLGKHGIEQPRLNAEQLLAHVLGRKRLELYMEFDRPLGEVERAPLRELVKSRSHGTPLQHLLGTAAFFGRDFLSDARALIPRPETERLVEMVLDDIKPLDAPVILDVGTGSGVIALTIALERPHATVHACDISSDALALASENALRHHLVGRVNFHQADLLPDPPIEADILVANLPYIASGDIPGLSREVQRDPVIALDGGQDGLDLIRQLVSRLAGAVTRPMRLALEIGHDQSTVVESLLTQHNFRDIHVARDYQDVPRFVFAKHG